MPTMTMRQRMLAVIRGQELDRVPFAQYGNLAGPSEEIWGVIGRGNMGLLRWGRAHRVEHPGCAFETSELVRDGRRARRTVLHTPEGDLVEESYVESVFNTAHIAATSCASPRTTAS